MALLTGLAGCSFGSSSDGTSTTDAGETYSIEVRNDITSADIEAMPYLVDDDRTPENGSGVVTTHLSPDEPARIRVEAARSVMGQEDPVLFERDLELPPETSRTFEDAFTTEPGGDTYVLIATLERFLEYEGAGPTYVRQYRFRPGEFNTPEDDTFLVRAYDEDPGSTLDVGFVLE